VVLLSISHKYAKISLKEKVRREAEGGSFIKVVQIYFQITDMGKFRKKKLHNWVSRV